MDDGNVVACCADAAAGVGAAAALGGAQQTRSGRKGTVLFAKCSFEHLQSVCECLDVMLGADSDDQSRTCDQP